MQRQSALQVTNDRQSGNISLSHDLLNAHSSFIHFHDFGAGEHLGYERATDLPFPVSDLSGRAYDDADYKRLLHCKIFVAMQNSGGIQAGK